MELGDAEPRQLFVVRARVNYNDVAVLPVSIPYLAIISMTGLQATGVHASQIVREKVAMRNTSRTAER